MKKILITFLLTTILLLGIGTAVFADDSTIEMPTIAVEQIEVEKEITISYNKIDSASGYIVYYSNSIDGELIELIDTKETSFSTKKLDVKKRYFFTVVAYGESKEDGSIIFSEYSNQVSNITHPKTELKPPASLNVSQKDKITTIKFSAVSKAKGYTIYYATSKTGTYKKLADTTGTTYTTTRLSAGKTYYFKIAAYEYRYDLQLYTGYSPIGSVRIAYEQEKIASQLPSFTLFQDNSKFSLEYAKVPYATSYVIYAKVSGDEKYTRIGESTKLSYSSNKFKINKKYTFKVRACAKIDGKSFYSKYSSGKSLKYEDPKVLADRSKIYKKSNGLQFNHVNQYDLSDLNALIKGLDVNTSFYLKDIESGKTITYNADEQFHTASTVKLGYCLYVYRLIEQGKASFSQKVTYTEADYLDKSGTIQFSAFGTQYTLKDLLYRVINVSDNAGYYMLRRTFGTTGYINMMKELGCSNAQTIYAKWGNLTPRDLGILWEDIYKFKDTKIGKVFWDTLVNAQFNFIKRVITEHPVAHKSGFNEKGYHDSAVVLGERKYIMVVMSDESGPHFNRTVRTLDTFMKQVR